MVLVMMQDGTMSGILRLHSCKLRILAFLLLFAAICLSAPGCASTKPTPYQPIKNGEGYQEDKVGEDQYLVEFRGNIKTTPAVTKNYLLYRCAALTLEKGCAYFVVLGMSDASFPPAAKQPLPGYLAQVKVFKDKPASSEGEVYDAKKLVANTDPKVVRKR